MFLFLLAGLKNYFCQEMTGKDCLECLKRIALHCFFYNY
jgi:hypothetical protein